MSYAQYSPKEVSIVIGTVPARGFADGEMVTVEYEEDDRSLAIGTDGEGRHIKNLHRGGTVTIRLFAFSPTNALITALDAIDVPFPITVVDKKSNGDLFFASSCALRKTPNLVKGKEESVNEFIFQFTKGKITHAGAKEV